MGGLGFAVVVGGFFGGLAYWLRRRERDGSFDIERRKTDKGTSFNVPGGGPP